MSRRLSPFGIVTTDVSVATRSQRSNGANDSVTASLTPTPHVLETGELVWGISGRSLRKPRTNRTNARGSWFEAASSGTTCVSTGLKFNCNVPSPIDSTRGGRTRCSRGVYRSRTAVAVRRPAPCPTFLSIMTHRLSSMTTELEGVKAVAPASSLVWLNHHSWTSMRCGPSRSTRTSGSWSITCTHYPFIGLATDFDKGHLTGARQEKSQKSVAAGSARHRA